jgi:hypothetical protein
MLGYIITKAGEGGKGWRAVCLKMSMENFRNAPYKRVLLYIMDAALLCFPTQQATTSKFLFFKE